MREDRLPRARAVEILEEFTRAGAEGIDERRVELRSAAMRCDRVRGGDPRRGITQVGTKGRSPPPRRTLRSCPGRLPTGASWTPMRASTGTPALMAGRYRRVPKGDRNALAPSAGGRPFGQRAPGRNGRGGLAGQWSSPCPIGSADRPWQHALRSCPSSRPSASSRADSPRPRRRARSSDAAGRDCASCSLEA